MRKYYSLTGELAKNNFFINFYRLLHIIGKYHHCPSNKRVLCALNIIRIRLNEKNIKGISITEIRSLIKEKKMFKFAGPKIYKISKRTDCILNTIFKILDEIEESKNIKLSTLKPQHFKENRFCRNQIISDFDQKLDSLAEKAPRLRKQRTKQFCEAVKLANYSC